MSIWSNTIIIYNHQQNQNQSMNEDSILEFNILASDIDEDILEFSASLEDTEI